MTEEILDWMKSRYPDGFYYARVKNVSNLPVSAIVALNTPVLLHLQVSQLQELITAFFEQGASPQFTCEIPQQNISGTIGDIALKIRGLQQAEIFLVIAE